MLIGILGAGQLGRMLALAGIPLGFQFRFLDPAAGSPTARLGEQIVAGYTDGAALARFAEGLALTTYEFENVPVDAATALAACIPVFPPPAALASAQDRLVEKRFFRDLGIPTAPFAPVASRAELDAALVTIGLPAVLKTRRLGYDGKGQALLRAPDEIEGAWAELGGQPLILEGFVPFTRELSVLAVRGRDGSIVCYPLVENTHRDGILRRSIAPAPGLTSELQAMAESYAAHALTALDYVGVLAIELFEAQDAGHRTQNTEHRTQGARREAQNTEYSAQDAEHHPSSVIRHPSSVRLLVNEMAPRVHNSGHWTIEGAETSQFENHLRAVAGLPLGSTEMRGHAGMINLIGMVPEPARVLAVPGAHLHLYDKAPRPGRKVGHITLRADDPQTLMDRVAMVERLVGD